MVRKRTIFNIMAAVCVLISISCSITTLDPVWKDPNYQGGKLKKVLIIGIAKNQTVRRSFEDKFVAQLKTYGTDAISSYTVIPSEEKLDEAKANTKIKALGFGAVLVTRVVNRKKEKEYVPEPYYSARPYGRGWYGSYSRGYGYATSPGYYTEYEVVNLETNIYDTQTEKLIWSGLSDTVLGGSVAVEIESVIKAIIKSLSDNQLI